MDALGKLKVALIQQNCTKDRQFNLDNSITSIKSAANGGAELVLLQELHTSLYFCQSENTANFDLAETIPGATTNALSHLAKELGIVIVCSIFEKQASGLYHNTAVAIEKDGSIAGIYRKMHIPNDPDYYEKFYFSPGDLGFTPIETSVGKLGLLICWDQWYPEAARLMALAGADILLYPTAIGWTPSDDEDEKKRQINSWKTVQCSHAIANSIPVLSCNRTGFEANPDGNGIQFWGNSFVAGPQGELIAEASTDKEEILITEINLARSKEVRKVWPFFRDRRIDAYDELLQKPGD
jgi:N-carbamoylputrescine amidase